MHPWRNGVYGFHHYHSKTHEIPGVYGGSARVKLGGEKEKTWDMNYGKPGELPASDESIKNVPLPELDPVFGPDGPVYEL